MCYAQNYVTLARCVTQEESERSPILRSVSEALLASLFNIDKSHVTEQLRRFGIISDRSCLGPILAE